jgi:hypothetical protein
MKITIFGLILSLFLVSLGYADIPKTLNYQGRLMNAVGQPVIDGQYNVTFRLYTAVSGGTMVWEEAQQVEAENGYFNTVLGNSIALTPSIFSQSLWVGIQVGTEAEMTPRQNMGTAAYAMNVADGAITTSKIADGTVTASKLNGEIQTGQILDNAITSEKIKDGEVKTNDIEDGTITNSKIVNDSITSEKILEKEVKTSDIADQAIVESKVKNGEIKSQHLSPKIYQKKAGYTHPTYLQTTTSVKINGLMIEINESFPATIDIAFTGLVNNATGSAYVNIYDDEGKTVLSQSYGAANSSWSTACVHTCVNIEANKKYKIVPMLTAGEGTAMIAWGTLRIVVYYQADMQ